MWVEIRLRLFVVVNIVYLGCALVVGGAFKSYGEFKVGDVLWEIKGRSKVVS